MSTALPAFRKLSALDQLALNRESLRLLPLLLRQGLSCEDAVAVAYNAALLYRVVEASPPFATPRQVLERYDLEEMASLCDAYHQVKAGSLEYGGREASA